MTLDWSEIPARDVFPKIPWARFSSQAVEETGIDALLDPILVGSSWHLDGSDEIPFSNRDRWFAIPAMVVIHPRIDGGTPVIQDFPGPPPAKLMARRKGRDLRTLPDYRIVTVNGRPWHRVEYAEGTGRGVRTHKRRGHIRRIRPDLHRWIDATMVRGSRPGEVEQIYKS